MSIVDLSHLTPHLALTLGALGRSLANMSIALLGATRRHWRTILEVTLTIILIVTCAAILWRLWHSAPATPVHVARAARPPEPPPPTDPISIAGAPIRGDAAAQTIVIMFSDFQCPYCGRFARETLPTIEERYLKTGKIRLVFESLPLDIHPFAFGAAVAAECASEQGRFWQMHDAIFSDQQALDAASLRAKGIKVGVDAVRFDACFASPLEAIHVKQSSAAARALSVGGTPTFFIGVMQPDGRVKVKRRFSGAMAAPAFGAILDTME
jgi:protein-disulfide isomerase